MLRTSSRSAESRFHGAISASLDAFFLFEGVRDAGDMLTDFRFIELNHRGEEFLGRPRERVLGQLLSEVILTARASGFIDRCVRVVETGESFAEEMRSDDPSLVAEWVHHQVVPVEQGIAIMSRDISERRRVEASLRASEERFRLLVESATDGIYRIDPHGIFSYANPVASRMLGVGEEEGIVGRLYLDFVRPDYRMDGIELYARQIKERIPVTYWEFPVVRTDGREVWIGQNVQIQVRGDRVVELFAVARDITARRNAEELLRASEERHRFLAEHSSDMLGQQSPHGKFLYVSPVCRTLLGLEPEAVVGRTLADLCDPNDAPQVLAAHDRLLASRKVEPVSCRVPRGDEFVWLETTSQVIADPSTGAITGILSVSRDITERRRLDEEIHHVQKMEAVGQLAGGVAHDFNNLLTSIRGFSDMLFQSIRPEDPRRSDLLEICKATDRAATLTRQLLAFSRRQVMRPEMLSLNTIVTDLARILQRLLGDTVTVSTKLTPALCGVRADPGQIEQVLLNLALNARDAMSDGMGTLTIETANIEVSTHGQQRHAPGKYAVLRVIDNGHGMTREVRERLFEPFFTTKERGRGTGLGLSMVYGIVAQSGGFITVESEPEQGASFAIHLPSADAPTEVTRLAPPRTRQVTSGAGTILIAEDSDGVLSLSERILVESGYTVLVARDGVEALEVARAHAGTIDLLLTDVMMPRMNGGELSRAFAAERPEAVIAMMSGYMDEEGLRRTLADPDTPILQKPFSAVTLLERIRSMLIPAPGRT